MGVLCLCWPYSLNEGDRLFYLKKSKLHVSTMFLHWSRSSYFVEQSWSSGLGTSLLTRGSCVRIPLRSRLEGSQCHPPPQGGTGCGKMDDISPSPTVGPALSRPGANKKKKKKKKKSYFVQCLAFCVFNSFLLL